MRRLILVTNQYPYATGDIGFVRGEASALSDLYDEVAVFATQAPQGQGISQMPHNFRLIHSFDARALSIIRNGLSRPSWGGRTTFRVLMSEYRRIRKVDQVRRLVVALLQGRPLARAISDFVSANDAWSHADVYFFWGAWGAYSTPWLRRGFSNVTIRMHGGDLYEERHGGYIPLREDVYNTADRIVTVSQHGQQYLLEKGAPFAKILVAPLGTPDRGTSPPPDQRQGIVIASCSSVVPLKRVELIAAAVCELARQGHKVAWTHFGGGPQFDALQEIASMAPPTAHITLHGDVSNEAVLAYYACTGINVFVNASESEGSPVSIMEALSFDIPVVAPAVGGIPEMIGRDPALGRLTPASPSPKQIAAAVLELSSQRWESPNFRRMHWDRNYRIDRNAKKLAHIVSGRA